MDNLDKAQKALSLAIDCLSAGNGLGANEQFAVVTTTMLNTGDLFEKRKIAEMAVEKLGEGQLYALQPPFQQLLARLASHWTEAAKWVASEGDTLAKQGEKAAATVRCCIARTLARDDQLPVDELVMGTLGAIGLSRDASALGNMALWQELLNSLQVPNQWFDRNVPPACGPLLQYYYSEVSWPNVAEMLLQLQQAVGGGNDVKVEQKLDGRQEKVLQPLFRQEVSLLNIEIGDETFPGFFPMDGRLCWLGPVVFTSSPNTDAEILRLSQMGYTAGFTPETGQGEEGFASWVNHILTKATSAGDFEG